MKHPPPLNSAGSREAGNDRRDGIGTVVSFSKGHDEDNPGTLDCQTASCLSRDTPHVRLYVLNMFRMRGSRL